MVQRSLCFSPYSKHIRVRETTVAISIQYDSFSFSVEGSMETHGRI